MRIFREGDRAGQRPLRVREAEADVPQPGRAESDGARDFRILHLFQIVALRSLADSYTCNLRNCNDWDLQFASDIWWKFRGRRNLVREVVGFANTGNLSLLPCNAYSAGRRQALGFLANGKCLGGAEAEPDQEGGAEQALAQGRRSRFESHNLNSCQNVCPEGTLDYVDFQVRNIDRSRRVRTLSWDHTGVEKVSKNI